jgi:transposase
VTGDDPEEEQAAGYAHVQYGYGSGAQKQVRYLQVTTTDGAVPVWDQPWDGNTTDVATVIATMRALREHARCTDFVLIGDSKLLSAANRQALLAAELGYLAPLARTPELDAAFGAISAEQFQELEYVSARDQAVGEAAPRWVVRRVFVISSEERAACRRNRARQRERAEAEIARVCRQVGTRWYPTAERAQAKLATMLERRHLRDLYQITVETAGERPVVRCDLVPDALARAEALDGYYVLETTRPGAEADASTLLAEWKGQWEIEHRHRAAKGPLRIRPLFVSSNQRIVGLITILGLALLVFSLIEREARRALGPTAKVPNLLAGHVAARPTGENVLKALREIALATVEIAGARYRLVAQLSPLQHTLLALLGVPAQVYTQVTAASRVPPQ